MKTGQLLVVAALCAACAAGGWFARQHVASASLAAARADVLESRLKAEDAEARADTLRQAVEELQPQVRRSEERLRAALADIPAPIAQTRIDSVLVRVPEDVREDVQQLVVENSRLRNALEEAKFTLASSRSLTTALEGEVSELRSSLGFQREVQRQLERALVEATIPNPWYRSEVALTLYGAAAGALLERALR